MSEERDRLEEELRQAREALVWADGLVVTLDGKALADYIPATSSLAPALEAAGCWAKGMHEPDHTPADPPDCFCRGLGPPVGFIHTKGECWAESARSEDDATV